MLNNELQKIVEVYILNNKTLEINSDYKLSQEIICSDYLIWQEEYKVYKLNLKSREVNLKLLKIAEIQLKQKLPTNISEIIKFVDDFEEELRKPQSNVTWAGLNELKNKFKTYLLVRLHNEKKINIIDFLNLIPKKEEKRESHLYFFESTFFEVLPHINIKVEDLLKIIKEHFLINYNDHNINDFCRNLGLINPKFAFEFYEYGKSNGLNDFDALTPNLLIGLYKNNEKKVFEIAKKLLLENQNFAISFFGRVQLKTVNEIEEVMKIMDSIDNENIEILFQVIYFYQSLLENNLITDEIIKRVFKKLQDYFKIENENFRNSIIRSLSWLIKGYEEERYDFLHFALETSKNVNYINEYFNNFKDPKYFFHLFNYTFTGSGFRTEIEMFENGLSHLWNSNREETEKYLLEIVSNSNKQISIRGIKLLTCAYLGIYPVDLLKLDSETKQLNSIIGFVNFPHSIETLIPVLLNLRKSKFPNVISNLQQSLSTLVFDSYQDYLYNLILENINKNEKKDMTFIKPIKVSLESYKQIKKLKNSIKDLDPYENEKDLMDLYYRLEHESHAIMMNKVKEGKGSFLQHLGKSVNIVRAHSWKLEHDEEVRPLGKIEHSVTLDKNAYKNPELFEFNLDNNKS